MRLGFVLSFLSPPNTMPTAAKREERKRGGLGGERREEKNADPPFLSS